MSQGNERNRCLTIQRSVHRQEEQKKGEKMQPWQGLTTKRLMKRSRKHESRLYDNFQDICQSYKIHHGRQKKLKNGINTRRKNFSWGKIQWSISMRDALTSLLFVISITFSVTYLGNALDCKFTKLQEKINSIMYMDDIKLFAKIERELETLIQSEYTAGL